MRIRLMAVPALALILAGPAVPTAAAAAAGPWINPANGAYLTSDTVTVNAEGANGGGALIVDGARRGFGYRLSYTIDGHQVANGRHHAVVVTSNGGYGGWGGGPPSYSRIESTFNMAVPAYAPAGVSVSASGTTVKVGWNRGPEPDLTGYSVSSRYGTVSVSASCSGGRCGASFRVPAGASGDLPVSVVANRSLSGPSRPSSGSVRLVAAPAKPKPRKSPTPNVTVQEVAPGKATPGEDGAGQPSDAALPEQSVEPPVWSPAPGTDTVVTSVASRESDEGQSTSSRLMMAWMFVFIFVLGVLGARFGATARRRRRREEALLLRSGGPRSRHRRQTLALKAGPENIYKWNEAVRLSPPGGRASDSLSSPGHAADSDADVPPRWT